MQHLSCGTQPPGGRVVGQRQAGSSSPAVRRPVPPRSCRAKTRIHCKYTGCTPLRCVHDTKLSLAHDVGRGAAPSAHMGVMEIAGHAAARAEGDGRLLTGPAERWRRRVASHAAPHPLIISCRLPLRPTSRPLWATACPHHPRCWSSTGTEGVVGQPRAAAAMHGLAPAAAGSPFDCRPCAAV